MSTSPTGSRDTRGLQEPLILDKGKPVVRPGRKAKDRAEQSARQPGYRKDTLGVRSQTVPISRGTRYRDGGGERAGRRRERVTFWMSDEAMRATQRVGIRRTRRQAGAVKNSRRGSQGFVYVSKSQAAKVPLVRAGGGR